MTEETQPVLPEYPSSILQISVPWTEYERDRKLREVWHNILSSPEMLEKLPSETWHGLKLQEILWSGKIDITKPDWEATLLKLWKE
jgi:hypothetical protein